jgi:hypothetical protein
MTKSLHAQLKEIDLENLSPADEAALREFVDNLNWRLDRIERTLAAREAEKGGAK